jgi:hypothetical protein
MDQTLGVRRQKESDVRHLVVLLLLCLVASPALAAEKGKGPSKASLAAAKQSYEEALRSFNLGLWDEAIAGFQKSYKLSGDAALLFNIAQAHRHAGRTKEAILAYRAFLRESPDAPNREVIEGRVRELEAELAATSSGGSRPEVPRHEPLPASVAPPADSPPPPPASLPSPPSAILVPPASAADAAAAPASLTTPAVFLPPLPPAEPEGLDLQQAPPEPSQAGATGSRWWLWTGIGVAVAAGITTAIILSARSPARDSSCPTGLDGCIAVGR